MTDYTEYISLDLLYAIIDEYKYSCEKTYNDLIIQKQEFCVLVSGQGRKTNYRFRTNGSIEIEKYHDYYNYEWENCESLDLLLNELIENQYIIEYNNKYWFINKEYTDHHPLNYTSTNQIWAWINILKQENSNLLHELNELKGKFHKI